MAEVNELNIETSAAKLVEAAANNDGMTAMRILEEVGSCNWMNVIDTANKQFLKDSNLRLSTASELDSIGESIQLSLLDNSTRIGGGGALSDNRVILLGKVGDYRCEQKPRQIEDCKKAREFGGTMDCDTIK